MPPQRRKGVIGKGAIGGGDANPLADGAEHTPPVSPLRDAEWRTSTQTPVPNVLAMPLPAPSEAPIDGPLDDREQAQLSACESSIDGLRVAFWAAGRALQIVRDGRLYRAAHATFDEYVEERWDMQRSYAHKLIRAWPLAAKLQPVAPTINEGQVRELLPVATEHGDDAAITVYTTIAGSTDVKVTAGKLRAAVALLPEHFEKAEVVELLQTWLRGELRDESNDHAIDLFAAVESRFAALTRRIVKGSNNDPAAAREFAAKLRTLAEQIEDQITV